MLRLHWYLIRLWATRCAGPQEHTTEAESRNGSDHMIPFVIESPTGARLCALLSGVAACLGRPIDNRTLGLETLALVPKPLGPDPFRFAAVAKSHKGKIDLFAQRTALPHCEGVILRGK